MDGKGQSLRVGGRAVGGAVKEAMMGDEPERDLRDLGLRKRPMLGQVPDMAA